MMGHGWNGMGWGRCGLWGGPGIIGFVVSAALWIGILVALVAGIVWLIQRLGRKPAETGAEETALSVARRRLAAGEITVGEFDEITHRLQGSAERVR